MKNVKFFIVIAAVMLFCSNTDAFTVSYKETVSGTGLPEPQTKLVKIRDDKVRMEISSAQGKTITIIDGKTMYSYSPTKNKAIRFTSKGSPKMDVLSDYATYLKSLDAVVIGNETVGLYECDIYEFTDPRTKSSSKIWLWKEKEFPVKVETKVPDGVITTVMEDVRLDLNIDDSEFALPKDVEIIDAYEAMKKQ